MMTEFIFTSGNFGTADCHAVSQMLRKIENSRLENGRILYLWQTLFPGKAVLEGQYPFLKKYPWLRPVAWVMRPFHRLRKNPRILRQKRATLRSISDENIENRRQSLKLVGLDFQF
jgi:hypothetical protein